MHPEKQSDEGSQSVSYILAVWFSMRCRLGFFGLLRNPQNDMVALRTLDMHRLSMYSSSMYWNQGVK